MTQGKIDSLELKHKELENQVLTVEVTQKAHFAKIDEVLTQMTRHSTKMSDVSTQLAVVISQMSDRHEFEKRMGTRMDKYEALSRDTFALAKSYEKPMERQESLYNKIIGASLLMIITCVGIIWTMASK